MSDSRKIVRIFLGSPGDLSDERLIAKSVVDEINSLFADSSGYHIELVGWEETVSSIGRPQALINQDLEKCELFVGMIWKRWGTPPDKNGFRCELSRWRDSRYLDPGWIGRGGVNGSGRRLQGAAIHR